MRLLLLLLIFTTVVAFCLAGEFSAFYKDSDHPGKCFYGGLVLSPGEQGQLTGKCKLFICNRADGFGTIQGCGLQNVLANCKLGDHIQPNGPYPDCCMRKVICP